MAVTLIATPGAANANTYATQAEADVYFAARLPLPTAWEEADDPTAALAMAARVIDAFVQPLNVYVPANGGNESYYLTRRKWNGTPATATQRLAWPRVGMTDGNGNAIASTVIPQALKDAQCELAGQLIVSDTTLDNAIQIGGITSVKAGSVAVSFKQMILQHVMPDAIWMLMPASWFTDEVVVPTTLAQFDVL